MQRLTPRTTLCLAFDVLLLGACIYHIPYLSQRGTFPFHVSEIEGRPVITRVFEPGASPLLRPGDELRMWDPEFHPGYHNLEFFSDRYRKGDSVEVTVLQSGTIRTSSVRLVPYHPAASIVMFFLVGVVAWCVGVFVLLARPADRTAGTLHWLLVFMGTTVTIAWGYAPGDDWWTYCSRTLFFISYAGAIATAPLFTLIFPRPKTGNFPLKVFLLSAPLVVLTMGMIYFHMRALALRSAREYNQFQSLDHLFHILSVIYVVGAILSFVHSFVKAQSTEERKKLKWILWGIAIGPTPFIFLTTLPEFVIPGSLVTESYTIFFLIVIPLAFGISFVKYQILDIEIVISRTTAYAIVITALLVVYAAVVGIAASEVSDATASITAAIVVALLFEPARKRVQAVVDKRFFRVKYSFREAVRRFGSETRFCVEEKQLAQLIMTRTLEYIPVDRIGVFRLMPTDNRLFVIAHQGFDLLEHHSVRFEPHQLKTRLDLPIALVEKVEPGILHEAAETDVFKRWGIAAAFPLKSATGTLLGFLVLGNKKSGQRFTVEDVDLVCSVSDQAGMELERIALQQQLLREEAETQRLAELNRLKSDFVSYVSHELRTPLTSIKLFAELLLNRLRKPDAKIREYIDVIDGEADRLNRMVTTILDSTRIEQGVKQYSLEDTDLGAIVTKVMGMMKYQLDRNKFTVRYSPPKRRCPIHADSDAVAEAIMNLIVNSIKYSGNVREVNVKVSQTRESVTCQVRDRGRGIPEESLPHLFEKFYRDPSSARHTEGVGLGLPLVRSIMEAHSGTVSVQSRVGKGSTFCLSFPRRRSSL